MPVVLRDRISFAVPLMNCMLDPANPGTQDAPYWLPGGQLPSSIYIQLMTSTAVDSHRYESKTVGLVLDCGNIKEAVLPLVDKTLQLYNVTAGIGQVGCRCPDVSAAAPACAHELASLATLFLPTCAPAPSASLPGAISGYFGAECIHIALLGARQCAMRAARR